MEQVLLPHINGLPKQPGTISAQIITYESVLEDTLDWLFDGHENEIIGLSTIKDGFKLAVILLSTEHRCLLVTVPMQRSPDTFNPVVEGILASEHVIKAGMDMDIHGLMLSYELGHITRNALCLTRVYNPATLGSPARFPLTLFGLFAKLYTNGQPLVENRVVVVSEWKEDFLDSQQIQYACLVGYVNYMCAIKEQETTRLANRLDLAQLDTETIKWLGQHNYARAVVQSCQSSTWISSFTSIQSNADGSYTVQNRSFRDKLESQAVLEVTLKDGTCVRGKVIDANVGKGRMIRLEKVVDPEAIEMIRVVDRAASRAADEWSISAFTNAILYRELKTEDVPFLDYIFAGGELHGTRIMSDYGIDDSLNSSQRAAIESMLCGPALNLVIGPPGSGKTTVISSLIKATSHLDDHFIVITGQTNAAVRNLAEALVKRGVDDFCLLVSDNFLIEWHETSYLPLNKHVIKSTELGRMGKDELSERIGPNTVVLCSLSQLSNPKLIAVLQERGLRHLLVDEASQIPTFALPHILALYAKTLRRISFVGDPKQLGPYGCEQSQDVESIFELYDGGCLLKFQYRFPPDIGRWISAKVYQGELVSIKPPAAGCSVAIVDAKTSVESTIGTGIVNDEEANLVVQVIMNQFVRKKSWLVVTPYNKQAELIKVKLGKAISLYNLNCEDPRQQLELAMVEDRIHTIDSIQGHEADYIILSLVRTESPGFLFNERRANVALTRSRCKLVIVCKLVFFLRFPAAKTLFGQFACDMHQVSQVVDREFVMEGKILDFGQDRPYCSAVLHNRKLPQRKVQAIEPEPVYTSQATPSSPYTETDGSKTSASTPASTSTTTSVSVTSGTPSPLLPPGLHIQIKPTTTIRTGLLAFLPLHDILKKLNQQGIFSLAFDQLGGRMSVFSPTPHQAAGMTSFKLYLIAALKVGLVQQAGRSDVAFNLLKRPAPQNLVFLECCSVINALFSNHSQYIELGHIVPKMPPKALSILGFSKVKDFAQIVARSSGNAVVYEEGRKGGAAGLRRVTFGTSTALY